MICLAFAALFVASAQGAPVNFVGSSIFGGPGSAPGNFKSADFVAVDPSGNVYVGDNTANYVNKFDGQGKFLMQIPTQFRADSVGCSDSPSPCFGDVEGLGTDSAGNLYVSDAGKFGRVVKFDSAGNYVTEFGRSFNDGTSAGASLSYSLGLGVNGSIVYVLEDGRIAEFTTAGAFVGYIGSGTQGSAPGQLGLNNAGVGFDAAGDLYVADTDNSRIEKFSASGAFLTQWGSGGTGPGQFAGGGGPEGVAVDPQGNVYVADRTGDRVEVFDATGNFLGQLGTPQQGNTTPAPGLLAYPIGVGLASTGGDVYVANSLSNYVDVFTPAPPAPPPPVLGKTVNATPVSGLVLIKPPRAALLARFGPELPALVKGQGFVALTATTRVPVGSQIDARAGTLNLSAAAATHGKLQQATLGGAVFTVSQRRTGPTKGLTTFGLLEGDFPGAPSYASCAARAANVPSARAAARHPTNHRVLQTLKAKDSHGSFRTSGRYSSATVLGTVWTTSDRCDGTLTVVKRGTVDVFDKVTRRTITVHAGHSYLAHR